MTFPLIVLLYYLSSTIGGALYGPSLQFLRRAGGLALAAALALSSAALAADTPALTAAERQEDLDLLCQSLERYHPDLFANTPEADFLARKAEIEGRLAGESDVEFALDLQSLAALAGTPTPRRP